MTFVRTWIQGVLDKARGKPYPIDARMTSNALFMLAARRGYWALRGLARLMIFHRRTGLLFLGPGVDIRNHRCLSLGRGVTLDSRVFIDALSQEGVALGDGVSLGRCSIIRCTGSLSDLGMGVVIGAGTGLDAFAFIGAAGGVRIGKNVIMGQHVSFHAENHRFDDLSRPIKEQGTLRAGIVIGDDCWVGSNVTFLDGCQVGSGCVIGAGSVVRGQIPDRAIVAGVPGRVIRIRGDQA